VSSRFLDFCSIPHLSKTQKGEASIWRFRLIYKCTLERWKVYPDPGSKYLISWKFRTKRNIVNADTLSPDGIQARLEELQKELIKKANSKQDYDAIADEIFRLRDQKEQSELDSHHREEVINRVKELQDFIAGQKTDIKEFDEARVKKLIEKITVFADHFTVEFKSGLATEIEA